MSRSNIFKACVPIIALSVFSACATPQPASEVSQAEATLTPKPTSEEIAEIKATTPLEQANFWNQQYNLHPTDLDISTDYINALMAIKSYERAAEVAKFTSVSFPEKPEIFMLLGKAMSKTDNAYEAAKAYGQAADLAPYDAAPMAAMAGVFDSRGDHESAQLAYQRALAIDPDRPITLSNFGISLTLVGKLEQAEEALAKATSLPDATPAIRQNYALVLGLLGKFDEARDIASIDAPNGIAERNTEFLKGMIGDNPQLQAIAQKAASAPTLSERAPIQTAETPSAAPTTAVATTALSDVGVSPQEADDALIEATQIASTPAATAPGPTPRLRSRKRNRTGGE